MRVCNPTITVIVHERTASQFKRQQNFEAISRLALRIPEQITEAVRRIVAARGVEPKAGFIADELSVSLRNGVEVSIACRTGRGQGFAIVRYHGEIVIHGFSGTFIPGEWQRELGDALEEIWHDQMHALALPGCADCKGFGVRLDEGEFIACDCTEKREPSFAVIHGANQQTIVREVAETMAA